MRVSANRMPALTDKHLASVRFPSEIADLHPIEKITPINPIGQQQQTAATTLQMKKSGKRTFLAFFGLDKAFVM